MDQLHVLLCLVKEECVADLNDGPCLARDGASDVQEVFVHVDLEYWKTALNVSLATHSAVHLFLLEHSAWILSATGRTEHSCGKGVTVGRWLSLEPESLDSTLEAVADGLANHINILSWSEVSG